MKTKAYTKDEFLRKYQRKARAAEIRALCSTGESRVAAEQEQRAITLMLERFDGERICNS